MATAKKIITVTAYGADGECASSSEMIPGVVSTSDFQEALARVKEEARLKFFDEEEGTDLLGYTEHVADRML